jgi:leader peptidase (prepilin peptidase) / N-methyltransferase
VTSASVAENRRNVADVATYGLAAFLSLLGVIRYGFQAETLVVVFFITTLVVISRHDIERHVIPNRIVVPAWLIVLAAHLILQPDRWVEWLVASFAAGGFFLALQLAYPVGLGMGDVKLALLIGAALGWAVVGALLIGTLASAVLAVALLLRHGTAARKTAIPLGPFLAGGALVVLLFL